MGRLAQNSTLCPVAKRRNKQQHGEAVLHFCLLANFLLLRLVVLLASERLFPLCIKRAKGTYFLGPFLAINVSFVVCGHKKSPAQFPVRGKGPLTALGSLIVVTTEALFPYLGLAFGTNRKS